MAKYNRKATQVEAVQYVEDKMMEHYWVVIDPQITLVNYGFQQSRMVRFSSRQNAIDSHYYDRSCEVVSVIESPPGWYFVRKGDWIVTDENNIRFVTSDEQFHKCFTLCQQ